MSLDVAKDAIDFFLQPEIGEETDEPVVELYGADPLLRKDEFEPVIKHFRKKMHGQRKKLRFESDSHRIDGHDNLGSYTKKELSRFRNTMSDNEDPTGWRYCCPSGETQYKEIKRASRGISGFNPNRIITRLPLTPSNLKIKEQVEELFNDGFKQVSFFPVLDEEWDKHFHYAVFRKELKKLADWYIESIRQDKIIPLLSINRMLLQYEAAQKGAGRPENPCNNRTMVVNANGEIMPCRHQLTKKQWILGDIYKGINQIRLDAYDSLVYSGFSGCKVCEAKMVCPGPCTAMMEDFGYDLHYPIKAHCTFTKAHYEAIKYIYHSLDMEDNQTFKNLLKKHDKIKVDRT